MSDPTSLPTGAPLTGAPVGPDLSELLRASARGDQAAFAQLYDATASRVHGLALRVVRDPAQAEEVTQEAYLEIWRTAARFDPSRGSALSWLLTLTHRKAVDRRGALASLTAVQREAVELAYFGGYTHTEVATMLELPVGTAKTRIRDGLIRLRDAMGVGQ